ncbi:insulinoma-associated protein 2 [Phyllopteryx taeniolatus]|uniref:insulinoma-associated protein 2 n=1 Tax=Phyllopteryx taeniolatus TaxID=161469 RepID=UPI002AD45A30|nr:insulinoma-associated protein 2 [Phyllopteryx taeniolatus]
MPRGFLVKRTRRCSASYRARSGARLATRDADKKHRGEAEVSEREPVKESDVWGVPSPDVAPPPAPREDAVGVAEAWNLQVESAQEAEADRRAQLPDSDVDVVTPAGDLSCLFPPPPRVSAAHSSRLVGLHGEGEKTALFPETCLSPSPETELPFLPTSVRVASADAHFSSYGPNPKYQADVGHLFPALISHEHRAAARKRSHPESGRHNRAKAKVTRKLTFEDEVTTSPVLGLRIKKESPETARRQHRDKSSGSQPLGEFICQLCKEEYADPLSLAQHKCSRIVRVEYRCPECDKVFSCPANLASHRRWHKPRPAAAAATATATTAAAASQLRADGKENELLTPDSSSPHYPHDSPPPPGLLLFHGNSYEPRPFVQVEEEGAEVYDCRYCGKKFRRQAYLKKHMAAHEMAAGPPPPTSSRHVVFVCHLCGARFPSADIRDKHRVWHAVRDELLQGGGGGGGGGLGFRAEGYAVGRECEQQLLTCKHCPATFLSSPGLARHMNKSHPGENMRVIMHMAVTH